MTKGIQITKKANISGAAPEDFTVNTLFDGSFKVSTILLFRFGGDLTAMSVSLGFNALIQRYAHNLGFVPAYLAYIIYGTPETPSDFAVTPYNNFVTVDGRSDFVNVDSKQVTVGFDTGITVPRYMKVIVFAEKLADS